MEYKCKYFTVQNDIASNTYRKGMKTLEDNDLQLTDTLPFCFFNEMFLTMYKTNHNHSTALIYP